MFESSYTENLDKTGGFGKIKFSGSVTFNINLLHHSYGGRMTVNSNSGHDTSKAELFVTNSAYGVVGGHGFGVVNDGSIDSTKTKDFSKIFTLNEMKDYGAVGVGPNMLMAKLALDIDAKKTGFAKWTYEDVPTKLWPVKPLSEMWGIGKQMEANLNKLGIQTVGGLANADLDELEKQFGVKGNLLYHHAWGIDLSKW